VDLMLWTWSSDSRDSRGPGPMTVVDLMLWTWSSDSRDSRGPGNTMTWLSQVYCAGPSLRPTSVWLITS